MAVSTVSESSGFRCSASRRSFRAKRYRGSVGSAAVRDFRGAMAGRGEKGLLISTRTFTADAKREARRDGAVPIDLIDGEQLCELLLQYGLGVDRIHDV